ncbi:unnamed protein product [Victoria cruziana]
MRQEDKRDRLQQVGAKERTFG